MPRLHHRHWTNCIPMGRAGQRVGMRVQSARETHMDFWVASKTTARGFEPLRAEPNGFRVHLLNRSDTLSYVHRRLWFSLSWLVATSLWRAVALKGLPQRQHKPHCKHLRTSNRARARTQKNPSEHNNAEQGIIAESIERGSEVWLQLSP